MTWTAIICCLFVAVVLVIVAGFLGGPFAFWLVKRRVKKWMKGD